MTAAPKRRLAVVVLVVSVILLVLSTALLNGSRGGWGHPGMWGSGGWDSQGWSGPNMMGPRGWAAGDGDVEDIKDARAAAGRFAERWGLEVGEVMEFDNHFYAELVEPSGDLATEVLVDRRTGSVQLEFGPAMMWNTRYGMHRTTSSGPRVDAKEARAVAQAWLADRRPGETAGEAEAFPGYYTAHVMRGKKIAGMLSVNASSGAVWYHSWHGRFIAMDEPDEGAE